MTDPADRPAGLRVIQGGLHCRINYGQMEIVAAPRSAAPFEVDALAVEEDTWLIMSAEPMVADLQEHPIRLMTELIEARPKPVGTVVVQGRNPLIFMAIVHDVNQDPTCREEWVDGALQAIFREAERRKIRTLGLPLIGTLHGKLIPRRFIDIFSRVLQRAAFTFLRRVWLIAPVPANAEIINRLQSRFGTT